jgi:uncharacterized protein CbrC (UPF0167 family)
LPRELPRFKYHLDPYRSKVLEPSSGPCPRCEEDGGVSYVGPCYALEDVEGLCPWCIADGSAARQWDLEFVDPAGPESLDDPKKTDELLHRTPGYFSAQGDPWPVHCDDYCALVGPVEWGDIRGLQDELGSDLERLQSTFGLTRDELVAELARPASPLWAHLFRCLGCRQHRLMADYE